MSARKGREVQREYPGPDSVGEDLLNGWIEMGMAKYPDQSLMAQKIVSIIMIETMTDTLLKTRLPKARLRGEAGRQDLKCKYIENESPISPNKPDAGDA